MQSKIQAVKGTRDFYPREMFLRNWLYQIIREVSESFGYQEYDGPFLEKIDLYAAKSGEELVKEQAFVFPDRGGNLITLRPELTLSLARMVAQKQSELVFPLKWWSFGPFWRYERPQKGRTREFFQWNIDLIGVNTPEADAEIVAVCAEFFSRVGITPNEVKILVNNRRLMVSLLIEAGISKEMHPTVFRLIDRKDKLSEEDWNDFALQEGLNQDQVSSIRDLMVEDNSWKRFEELVRFFEALNQMGYADYVEYDPQIVRGLDYYTGTVFEARDIGRDGRAILGGGRYDNLVGDVGGDPIPGVGFAMGDVMALLMLEKYDRLPEARMVRADVLVSVFDKTTLPESLKLASMIRKSGIACTCYPEDAKLSRQFKYADKMGIRYVIVQGPDEAKDSSITLKDLITGNQQLVSIEGLIEHLDKILAGNRP